jgi:glycosyltransferase involved in cell wall biosynthesis
LPHVTVTIPAFNHEAYIARAIESVLNQSQRDFDVAVVDDGSSDASFEVARRYESDPRVRCERNPENLGLARNWNRCLDLAAGPLVMVFGDDDGAHGTGGGGEAGRCAPGFRFAHESGFDPATVGPLPPAAVGCRHATPHQFRHEYSASPVYSSVFAHPRRRAA